ncbi:hypothetical protein [Ottowia sp.]|uniref:hypothetical protein n=1 Tax=Ottowia sp. TaxID=1898956 RepID=UPI0039E47503
MAKVSIALGKAIDVANTDNVIDVAGYGKLRFSTGSVEWLPFRKSVHGKRLTWKQFAQVLEEYGAPAVMKKAGRRSSKKPVGKSGSDEN